MAITAIHPQLWTAIPADTVDTSSSTMDAAAESLAIIGTCRLAAGSGSKTISTGGGGGIWIRVATVTAFANAGTTIRVGVQDVASAGIEDGTFDVNGDLVGGTDTLTAATYHLVAMDAGTKTIANGDTIAIVAEMISRGGADSVAFDRVAASSQLNLGFPYGTADTGTLARNTVPMFAVLKFDDGTIGWIQGMELALAAAPTTNSFNSGSTPDEYGASFIPQVPMQVSAVGLYIGNVGSADTYEIVFYSDPYGTPTIIETVTPDQDLLGSTSTPLTVLYPITSVTLTAGVTYLVALRPTSTNNIGIGYYDLGSGFSALKGITPFSTDCILATRTNQTGAFSASNAEFLPGLFLLVTGLDDGATGATVVALASQSQVISPFRVVGY